MHGLGQAMSQGRWAVSVRTRSACVRTPAVRRGRHDPRRRSRLVHETSRVSPALGMSGVAVPRQRYPRTGDTQAARQPDQHQRQQEVDQRRLTIAARASRCRRAYSSSVQWLRSPVMARGRLVTKRCLLMIRRDPPEETAKLSSPARPMSAAVTRSTKK